MKFFNSFQRVELILSLVLLWFGIYGLIPPSIWGLGCIGFLLRILMEKLNFSSSIFASILFVGIASLLLTVQFDDLEGLPRIISVGALLLIWRFFAASTSGDQVFLQLLAPSLLAFSVLLDREPAQSWLLVLAGIFWLASLIELPVSIVRRFWIVCLSLLVSIPVAGLLYAIFPRAQAVMKASHLRRAISGFSDQISPGRFTEFSSSTGVALRIFSRPSGLDPTTTYYRGGVLAEANGLRWKKGAQNRTEPSLTSMRSERQSWWIEQLVDDSGWLFVPEPSAGIVPEGDETVKLSYFGEGVYRTSSVELPRLRFRSLAPEENHGEETAKSIDRSLFSSSSLRIEEAPKEIQELIAELRIQSPEQAVQEILDYYVARGFEYELTGESVETLYDFLLKTKKGYCEHFAASTASLLRLAGFGARVVVGYYGALPSLSGNHWYVTKDRAHAWVEFIGTEGQWIRSDPTRVVPLSEHEKSRRQGIMYWHRLRAVLENLDVLLATSAVAGLAEWMTWSGAVDEDFRNAVLRILIGVLAVLGITSVFWRKYYGIPKPEDLIRDAERLQRWAFERKLTEKMQVGLMTVLQGIRRDAGLKKLLDPNTEELLCKIYFARSPPSATDYRKWKLWLTRVLQS